MNLQDLGFTVRHVGDGDILLKGLIAGKVQELFLTREALHDLVAISDKRLEDGVIDP